MTGVGQANERQVVLSPIASIGVWAVRTNGEDFRVTRGEGRVVVAQAREVGAAVRSHEAAQEGQHHIPFSAKVRKSNRVAVEIRQFEIGGGEFSHQ